MNLTNVANTKREGVVYIASKLSLSSILIVPTVNKPFVPADRVISVSESLNFKVDLVASLDDLLVGLNCSNKFTSLEEPISRPLSIFKVWCMLMII
jgi:hypothetical protein